MSPTEEDFLQDSILLLKIEEEKIKLFLRTFLIFTYIIEFVLKGVCWVSGVLVLMTVLFLRI